MNVAFRISPRVFVGFTGAYTVSTSFVASVS
jgi:hypothetical protein